MNIINSPLAASQSNSGILSSWNTNTPHRPSFSSHLSAPFDTSTVNNASSSHHVHKDSLPIFSSPISPPFRTPNAPTRHGKRKHTDDENVVHNFTTAQLMEMQMRIQFLDGAIPSLEKSLADYKKEQETLIALVPQVTQSGKKRAYTPRKNIEQKLQTVFAAVSGTAKWTLDQFLYYLFRLHDEDGNEIKRSSGKLTLFIPDRMFRKSIWISLRLFERRMKWNFPG